MIPDENTAVDSLRTHAVDYVYQPSIVTNEALRSAPGVHIVWVNACLLYTSRCV